MKFDKPILDGIARAKAKGKYYFLGRRILVSEEHALKLQRQTLQKGGALIIIVYPGEGVVGQLQDVLDYVNREKGRNVVLSPHVVSVTISQGGPKSPGISSKADLTKLTVTQLRILARKRGVTIPEKALKGKIVDLIWKGMGPKSPAKKPISPKKSPAKTVQGKKCGTAVCDATQYCNVDSKKCVKETKTGRPFSETRLRKALEDNYDINEQERVFGSKPQVLEYLEKYGLIGKKKPPPLPPKKLKKKGCFS